MIDPQAKAKILLEALPYMKEFADRTVIVKGGGEIVDNPQAAASFARDIVLLRAIGVRVVLCHGGGPQISRTMEALGKEPVFRRGLRVTDDETLEVTAGVLLGTVNRRLVSLLNAHGPLAVGVSGVDARMFVTHAPEPDLGLVGEIVDVNPEPVDRLLDDGYIPVVASLGMGADGATHNINADVAAGALAGALGAEKYIVLTNVAGLYESFGDADTLLSQIDAGVLRAMRDSGTLSAGMIPKVDSILAAMDAGVRSAHILDGRLEHSVLLEIFTRDGVGTMVRGAGESAPDAQSGHDHDASEQSDTGGMRR